VEKYPDSPLAHESENRLAQELFDQGKYDLVLAEYPQAPSALPARENLAMAALTNAAGIKESGKLRLELENVMTTFAGTPAADSARVLLTAIPPEKPQAKSPSKPAVAGKTDKKKTDSKKSDKKKTEVTKPEKKKVETKTDKKKTPAKKTVKKKTPEKKSDKKKKK
jgi:hypothetical protein